MNQKVQKLARRLKENPNDSFTKFALALEMRKVDQLEKARRLFESIREHDPQYVGVYYHLGKLYEALDESDRAKTIYKEGITITQEKQDQHAQSELQTALMNLEISEYE